MKKTVRRHLAGPLAGCLAVAVCLLALSEGGHGQVSPTPEMLQIFQGLTPEQQDAILKQVTGGGGTGAAGGGALGALSSLLGGGQGGDKDAQEARRQALADQAKTPEEEEEQQELASPGLKRDDWVVIEVELHPVARPPAANQSQAVSQLAAQAQSGSGGTPNPAVAQALAALASSQAVSSQRSPSDSGKAVGELNDEERARLEQLITLIRSRNPYQLSHDGVLTLPGFTPIPLLGLTEEQASLRLRVDPAFHGIDVHLTRLPLKKTGVEGLKPFGYSLFNHRMSTFAPVTNVPLPSDYVVGPGDELNVQLYGNQNRVLRFIVGRDGRINFPSLGPLNVGGQSFNAVRAEIESRVERQMIGVRASVSMGDTGAIRVFVLGEARRPGSYTISALGTITSALYAAGGAKEIGSLRNIQLKRRGALVRSLDLYDLLIRGDTSDDAKLVQGDVIFIPPVGSTVSVDGEVRRPAIYEIKHESTLTDVVQLAGGLTPEADTTKAMLTRIDLARHRIVIAADLSAGARSEAVQNGDLLRVLRLRPTVDSGIVVQGHLYAPGTFAYHQGIRLSEVIHSVEELRPDADIHYLLIRREVPPDRRIAVVSADLAAALRAPGSAADLELMPRDRITVFDLASGRDRVIQPVLDELRLQGTSGNPSEVVRVDGSVKVEGEYPLETGMRVSDLVRAGGGTADAAYANEAELTRYTVGGDQSRHTEHIPINLAAALQGDPAANIRLQPFDSLSVKEVPLWEAQESVAIKGEVRFPGEYTIRRGETLASVLARAGGLTDFAFPEGSVFTRESLRRREQEQLDLLAERMQRDLTVLALQTAAVGQGGGASALSVGQSLLSQLRTSKGVGRLVIDLPRLTHSPVGSSADVVLRGGDQLIVPKLQQQVMVIGEVQYSTSHLYSPRLGRDDYISLSGGMTRRADHGRIYVVRANGSVVAQEGSRWFQQGAHVAIKPGDTIVVPLDVERIPPLPFWQAVTTIMYNIAIAVAAVHTL
jgi:polysaccharide export outer membrane protein